MLCWVKRARTPNVFFLTAFVPKEKVIQIKKYKRFNLLTEIVADLSRNNKLNLMIFDGDLTYIHSNMKDSLYYLKNDEGFLIASTPLDDDKNWKPVELNKLFGLIDGNIIFESEDHGNDFVFTEEHIKFFEDKFVDENYEN